MINQAPILITGCPRSGTGMVAGILSIAKVFGGYVDRMYENITIREVYIKNYLRSVGMDADACCPIVAKYPIAFPEYWEEKITECLTKQGVHNQEWYYKDSRNAVLWRLWSLAFPQSRWIIVRRSDEDIIESCQKTGYMRTFDSEAVRRHIGVPNAEEGWKWVIGEYKNCFTKIQSTFPNNYREIWPEKMAAGDYSEITELLQWLGLAVDIDKVKDYIKPKLYKTSKKYENDGRKS